MQLGETTTSVRDCHGSSTLKSYVPWVEHTEKCFRHIRSGLSHFEVRKTFKKFSLSSLDIVWQVADIYVLPFTTVNGCNLCLNPISCKSCRAARLSFVFLWCPVKCQVYCPWHFFLCAWHQDCAEVNCLSSMTVWRKYFSSSILHHQYLLHPSSASSVSSYPHSHPQMQFRPTVEGFRPCMVHLEKIVIVQYRQMFVCSAVTDALLAGIFCAPCS